MLAKTPLEGRCILVVDDDATMRQLLDRILRVAGATVLTASDGATALNVLDRCRLDLILTDIDMPVMNGLEEARNARCRGYRGKIIAVSASGVDHACLTGAGIDKMIPKPFRGGALVSDIVASLPQTQAFLALQPERCHSSAS